MLRHGVRSRLLTVGALAALAIPWSYVAADEPRASLPSGQLEVRNVIPASDIGLDTIDQVEVDAATDQLLVNGVAEGAAQAIGRRLDSDGTLVGVISSDIPEATLPPGAEIEPPADVASVLDGTAVALTADGSELIRLSAGGDVQSRQEIAGLGIGDVTEVAVAPTGDRTDDPETLAVFVVAAGPALYELGEATAAVAGTGPEGELIRTIDTSNAAWGPDPSSSDPSGLAYWPARDQLIVTDGEIDEIAMWYQNANIFEVARATGFLDRWWLSDIGSETNFEPTGAAYDQIGNRLFLSADVADEIQELSPGNDGEYGTGDDTIDTWSAASLYGATDPEGLAFGAGALWIADGTNREVYRIEPGANGDFGDGDDSVSHFDVMSLGITNAADGIEYDIVTNLLYVASVSPGDGILELTPDGTLLRTIGLDALPGGAKPAGLALAPASSGGGTNLYVADRNVDNLADPNENDGRIFELHFSLPAPPPPVPDTTINSGPAEGSSTTSTSASFTFSGTPTPTSFQCKLDGSTFTVCTSPKTYNGLAVGSHTFSVRAIGPGGTDQTPATRTWTISTAPPPPPPPPPDGHPFTDIGGHPFENDIVWLYDAEITGGCTSTLFCPDANVLRDQMASFLDRALNLAPTAIDFFTDDEGNIHEAAINRLAAAGITGGCDVRQYCPKDSVLRDQMASFLDRAYTLAPTLSDHFTDDEANIHEASINRLASSGITGGCGPGRYCPKLAVTRGQMAAFLHRGDPFAT